MISQRPAAASRQTERENPLDGFPTATTDAVCLNMGFSDDTEINSNVCVPEVNWASTPTRVITVNFYL